MMRKLAYALPATLSFALIACGGGPNLDQVKADFQNPTGSVQNKDAMVASSGSLNASGGAIEVAGGGVPGASLTATGKVAGLRQLNVQRAWEGRARTVRDYLNGKATAKQALSEAQTGFGCDDSAEAQEAFQKALNDLTADAVNPFGSGKKISGKASYKLDLTSCSNGELSGSASIEIEIVAEQTGANSGRFAFTVKYNLNNVCELNTEEKTCVDGSLIAEAEAVGQDEFGSLTFTEAWELDGNWLESGVERNATLKGGIRSAFEGDGNSGNASIEILNYVNTPDGEWSYVWSVKASYDGLNGTGTFEVRGQDGSVTCTVDDNGGMCSGSDGSSISWTAEDEQGLDDSWFGG